MEERNEQYPEGIKWTKQRKDVFHILNNALEPLSAAEIYALIVKKDPEVTYAVSTIYRILGAFEEQGFVEKTTFMGDDTVRYEWNRHEHTHYAVCLTCHKKVPVHVCPLEHLSHHDMTGRSPWAAIAKSNDFVVTSHKLELYGYCKDCEAAIAPKDCPTAEKNRS